MGWLSNKIDLWSLSRAEMSFDDFLTRLSAMDSRDIGLPVVLAVHLRNLIRNETGADFYDPYMTLLKFPAIIGDLVRQTQDLQRSNLLFMAPGPMIWTHTLRAAKDLRLRPRGRMLWSWLRRGFPHVEAAAREFSLLSGYLADTQDFDRVPEGMGEQQ